MALLKKLNLAPAKADMVKQSSESIPSEIDKVIVVLSEAEREEYEERAAIMEYDGGLSRAEAERQALERILAKRGNLNGTKNRFGFF